MEMEMKTEGFFIRLMSYVKTYIPEYTYDQSDYMILHDSSNNPPYSIFSWNLNIPKPNINDIEKIPECDCETMPNFIKISLEERVKQLGDKIVNMQITLDQLDNIIKRLLVLEQIVLK